MTMINTVNIVDTLSMNIGHSIFISKESPLEQDLSVNINDFVITNVYVDKAMNIERTYKLVFLVTGSHRDFNIGIGSEIEMIYIEKLGAYSCPSYTMNRIGDDRKCEYYFNIDSLKRLINEEF